MRIEIRAASTLDIEKIARIEALSFSDPWSESAFKAFLSDGNCFLVLTVSDEILGYAVLGLIGDSFAELYNIAVHPEHRKKGLSTLLMQTLTDTARAHSKDRILLEVRASNAPAIALYEKFGFKVDGVRKSYYTNPKEDGILMSLNLQ